MRRFLLPLVLCLIALPLSAATAPEHIAAGRAALDRDDNEKAVELFSKAIELEPGKKHSIAVLSRASKPGGPARVSGAVRRLTRCASRRKKGSCWRW